MNLKYLPESERPLEKAIREGIGKLSNAELLAIIINSGTKECSAIDVAHNILAGFPLGISQLGEATYEDLTKIAGIGRTKAVRILGVLELGRRISTSMPNKRPLVESDKDVAEMLMDKLRHEKKEHFFTIVLDSKGHVLQLDQVSVGELSSTVVHPREVFSIAIRKSGASVIFAHNHPSGDPSPSKQDIETTRRLVHCGRILGIKVLDHIIIGNGRYISLRACDDLEIFGGSD
ncbi:MAG: DNA repair protein RadC [Peptostreptococcaceae bacterium]|nr:DNA repair protein RadC [Peptostreptococcaceae bacterium]MDY5738810.1 DNA repair protein RadC [Anaerovoracaceae bacterium]